jgi:transcriptional regulator with XRE-family HTH domain
LSQQQVSERIGIEPESISRIENGDVSPSLARLRQFAELYSCSLEAVIGEASDLPADVASRIARELADLPEPDRSFVAEQTINLIAHIKASRRRR